MMRRLPAFLALILIINNGLWSQSPWCDGYHQYQNSNLGGYSSSNYVIAIEQVRIRQDKDILYNHAADGYSGGTSCGEEYRLSNPASQAFNLKTGHTYTIDANSSSAYTYNANFGLFIDINNDKDFLDQGEYLGTWSDVNNGPFKMSALKSKAFVVPCNAKLGPSRLRLVCNYNVYTMNASYGCTSCSGPPYYGETVDFSINITPTDSSDVDFLVPEKLWIKTSRHFINKNDEGYLQHAWDINNDGVYEQIGSNPNYTLPNNIWTVPGNKCVKLRSTNCLGTDSVIKCFYVDVPSATPNVDFIGSSTAITQYELVKFFDISENGPYKWSWNVYDSTTYASIGYYPSILSGDVVPDPSGNGLTQFTSTPEFQFDLPGCYKVELTATNDVGPSVPRKKTCYVKVTLPNKYNLGFGTYGNSGDNYVQTPTGTISDNGGPNLNYYNNQGIGSRSFLCISPCNVKNIILTLRQIKLKDSQDVLKIWDGNTPGGPKTTLLGVYSSNSRGPVTLNAKSGSMFILFESDGFGTDSGFYGDYTCDFGPPGTSPPAFSPDVNKIHVACPVQFINTSPEINGQTEWEWTIDKTTLPGHKDKSIRHTFESTGDHEVCLNMKTCSGSIQSCDTFNVTQASTPADLTVQTSKTRTVPYETVHLKIKSEIANRFEVIISPGTFKLSAPLQSPSYRNGDTIFYLSILGDSLPVPEIQFTTSGCYDIAVRAYNNKDKSGTFNVYSKSDMVCVLDYCKPVSYILSNEIGINKVRLSKDNITLLEKTSNSGLSAYADYANEYSVALNHCQDYLLEIERYSHKDAVNIGVYIDWNTDGDFADPGETIAHLNNIKSGFESVSFSVPKNKDIGIGVTRLRITCTYSNQLASSCGPYWVGEAEDYSIEISRDLLPPELTLTGNDTVTMIRGNSYVEYGASATDNIEGDISANIHITDNIDANMVGDYWVKYTVCDCSENCISRFRTVRVLSDIPPPVIQLNPGPSSCIEARRDNPPYNDPGAIAYGYAPLTNLTDSIRISGTVDTRTTGDYTIKYSVTDIRKVSTTVSRHVCVKDYQPPQIITAWDTNIQLGNLWFDPTYAIDAYDLNPVLEKIWTSVHQPNPYKKAIYTVKYLAHDADGNYTDTMYVHYKVDDYIDPMINLNTDDVVYHEVRTAYNSIPVTVTDNYYGPDQTVVRKISSNVDEFKIGIYYEIFEAVDGSGNISKKTRTVIVRDQIAPRIWANSMQGCVGETIWPFWGLYVSDNYYSANELKPFIEILSQNVNIWEEGIYAINYRVTDPSGNSSEPFTRYVNYRYAPNCHNSSTDIEQMDSAGIKVTLYPNPASDWIRLDCMNFKTLSIQVGIYDITGRMVKSGNYDSASINIDIKDLPAGIYTVTVQDGDRMERKTLTIVR